MYKAERFKTKGQENLKEGADNIANALKEGIKRIETWFKKCINKF